MLTCHFPGQSSPRVKSTQSKPASRAEKHPVLPTTMGRMNLVETLVVPAKVVSFSIGCSAAVPCAYADVYDVEFAHGKVDPVEAGKKGGNS